MLIDGRDATDCSLRGCATRSRSSCRTRCCSPAASRDNIAYGTDATDRADRRRRQGRRRPRRSSSALPDGYDTELGPQGTGLSGGQRQRIGIARTLLRNPPVIILDEPTTALDQDSEDQVLEGLDRLMRGRTCILITHSARLARTADQIIELDHGRIVQRRSPMA